MKNKDLAKILEKFLKEKLDQIKIYLRLIILTP